MPDRHWLRAALCCLLVAVAAHAGAQTVNQCIDRCFTTFSPSQMDGSKELRRECLEICNKKSSTPRVQQGAIAFDPRTGAWGIANGKASAGDAAQSALLRCREHGGGNSQLAASYADRCAAVAAVKSKARFTAAQGRSLAEAKAGAMRACQAQVGGDCVLWVYGCA